MICNCASEKITFPLSVAWAVFLRICNLMTDVKYIENEASAFIGGIKHADRQTRRISKMRSSKPKSFGRSEFYVVPGKPLVPGLQVLARPRGPVRPNPKLWKIWGQTFRLANGNFCLFSLANTSFSVSLVWPIPTFKAWSSSQKKSQSSIFFKNVTCINCYWR